MEAWFPPRNKRIKKVTATFYLANFDLTILTFFSFFFSRIMRCKLAILINYVRVAGDTVTAQLRVIKSEMQDISFQF